MKSLRGLALFAAGLIVGSLGMQSLVAQQNKNTNHRINHVGIRAKDYQQSVDFYTKILGFKLAYKFPSPDGSPTTTELQVNKDTFVELAPPAAGQPAGLTHFAVYTDDAAATVAQFRQAGATVDDAVLRTNTGAKVSGVMDPNGIRIEILELPAESPMRKALDAWR
jgi:catechol 2,3-dioxygenase-like lactoylglutathione lyase family enzyme